MRIPLVAGNWKMNKTVAEARDMVSMMSDKLLEIPKVDKVLCPPFLAIPAVADLVRGTGIGLGAQDVYWKENGAFTGEVSAAMVKEFCEYVIIGHSERRAYFGDTNETVNRKLHAALNAGLTPIVCVGETLEQHEAGNTSEIVRRQVTFGLGGVGASSAPRIVIAYEPVWAIGTGKASSAENANFVHREIIRTTLADLFGAEATAKVRILYGGSVTAANAAGFFDNDDIDGALVGGASLKPEEFVAIAKAAATQ